MGEPVEQSASEAFGAEHLGPFGKRQRLEVLRGQEVVQPGEASSPRSARVVAVARCKRLTASLASRARSSALRNLRSWASSARESSSSARS